MTMSRGKNQEPKRLTPRERFLEVAKRRTNSVIKGMKLLKQCSNPRDYEYSTDEYKKIFRAIKQALREAEMEFQNKGKSNDNQFNF